MAPEFYLYILIYIIIFCGIYRLLLNYICINDPKNEISE